jgi:hypothetical protein
MWTSTAYVRRRIAPRLFDIHIIGMSPQAFSLTGFERVDGTQYAQSWLVQFSLRPPWDRWAGPCERVKLVLLREEPVLREPFQQRQTSAAERARSDTSATRMAACACSDQFANVRFCKARPAATGRTKTVDIKPLAFRLDSRRPAKCCRSASRSIADIDRRLPANARHSITLSARIQYRALWQFSCLLPTRTWLAVRWGDPLASHL